MTLTRSTTVAPESRVQPLQLRLEDAQVVGGVRKYLEGRAVPYNTPTDIGWFTETFRPGAFAKSIRESAKNLPLLLFHDAKSLDAIIGQAEQWTEAADGLWGKWALSTEDHAQRAARMAEEGLLGFLSVGFMPMQSLTTYDDNDRATVERVEARLLEVSLTPTPAFQAATVSKVRSAEISLHEHVSGRKVNGWREWVEKTRAAAL